MNEDIHRWLDGELERGLTGEDERREAAAWERLLETFRAARPAAPAPRWLEDRVMAEIEALPEAGPLARLWGWLLRPQPLAVSPAAALMAAGALAAVLLLSRPGPRPPGPGGDAAAEAVVYVQFLLEAPGAASVSVGGDFDAWRGSHPLQDPDGDGVWTGRVPVQPGVHEYMFLVDGSRWVTDPGASRYTDDGFGNRNAVLAVAAPAA